MKNENFNLNINALDDKAIYTELCKKIKETNDISFKLLCYVPLISGGIITIIGFYSKEFSLLILVSVGIFGAAITYCIYQWEMRNIQANQTYRNYAGMIETKKKQQELDKDFPPAPEDGPFNLLIDKDRHVIVGKIRWGRIEAERAIYLIVILFWLILPFMKLIPLMQVTML